MLSPKRYKYRKAHKGRVKGIATKGETICFGKYGLKAKEVGRITARQIEATRKVLRKKMRVFNGKVWIRIFPDIPVTSKPKEVRMGKGKGSVSHWICRVKPGKVLFEISDIEYMVAKDIFRSASLKLPIRTKFVEFKSFN
jgi:large subunit ribosomal protein L16